VAVLPLLGGCVPEDPGVVEPDDSQRSHHGLPDLSPRQQQTIVRRAYLTPQARRVYRHPTMILPDLLAKTHDEGIRFTTADREPEDHS